MRRPGFPKRCASTLMGRRLHVAAGMDAAQRQESADAVFDAAEFRQRHLLQTRARFPGRDHREAVGFVQFGSVLGGGLVAGYADAALQAGSLKDDLPGAARHAHGIAEGILAGSQVQEGLVHGEHFDVRGDLLQGLHDGGGDLRVAFRAGRALHEHWAQAPSFLEAHAGLDAVAPGFVRAGDDAGAGHAVGDADGTALELRKVPLLDAGEEGVHVDEGDGAGPTERTKGGHGTGSDNVRGYWIFIQSLADVKARPWNAHRSWGGVGAITAMAAGAGPPGLECEPQPRRK